MATRSGLEPSVTPGPFGLKIFFPERAGVRVTA